MFMRSVLCIVRCRLLFISKKMLSSMVSEKVINMVLSPFNVESIFVFS